ncbi:MAG: glycosyltransferase family 39 protein [Betaproteobacteria bacterium]
MRRLAPPPDACDGVGAGLAWAIVALLAVLHAAPYFVTFVEGDFARDLYAALRIVQGRAWPLEGPIIAGTLHLGPVWYYTLAAMLAIGGSVTAVVAGIAVLASLQFPLAYRLGAEAYGRATGLAWAILLALPGVGSLTSLWIAHPSVTPTLVLATLFALWRAHTRRSPGWLAASGAAFGLALHAHPTTLPLALPLAWVAAGVVRTVGARGAVGAVAALALAAAPFLPLASRLGDHLHDALALSGNVAGDAAMVGHAAFLTVADNLLWRVPDLVTATWIASDGRPLLAWRLFVAAVYLGSALGLALIAWRGERDARRTVLVVALSFVAWLAFTTAIRGVTRFYMLYATLPLLALLLALGLRGLALQGRAAGVSIARALLAGVVAWAAVVGTARIARALDDDVRLPPLLGAHVDMQRADDARYSRLHYLSTRHLDAIGRRLCVDGVVHLYGDLAQVVDSQFNVPAQMRCGDASRVVIGGVPATGEHAFFLVQRSALVPRAALRDFGGFGFGSVAEVLVSQPSLPIARGEDYPSRKGCGTPSEHAFAFTTQREATLIVASGLAITCPVVATRLERDGQPVAMGSAGDVAWVRVPAEPARWRLTVETAAPLAVQVFTVAPPAP